MKQMTETQAWAYLAGRWAKARPYLKIPGRWHTKVLGDFEQGLCGSLWALEDAGRISGEVWGAMLERVVRNGPPEIAPFSMVGGGRFRWPLTARGARSRAAFCRRMARLARKERAALGQ